MDTKKLVIATIAFFLISAFSLAYIEKKQADEDFCKDWWAAYFSDPKGESLSFVVENHSRETEFQWEITEGKRIVREGDIEIKKGSKEEIIIEDIETEEKEFRIKIVAGDEKREIFKNFEK